MAQGESRRWVRAASGALSIAHSVAFGAQSCCAGAADSFNMLLLQHQQPPAAARREPVLGQPPRGSNAGSFVQPRILFGGAASFQLPWERTAARQTTPKRQLAGGRRTARGAERAGPCSSAANGAGAWHTGDNTNVSPNRSATDPGGSTKAVAAAAYSSSAHQPQPVRAQRLRQRPTPPPPPPPPPPLPPSFSAKPALELQPGVVAGETDAADASGPGSAAVAAAAAPCPPQAEQPPSAAETNAPGAAGGSPAAGKPAETRTDDRLTAASTAGDGGHAGRPFVAGGGATAGDGEDEARPGGRGVEKAVGSAAAGAVGERGGGGSGGGSGEWCPVEARARACEAVPQLSEAFRKFDEKHPGATIIYLAHSGSRMYGTSTPNSDVDVKGIFIPDSRVEKEARGMDDAPDLEVDPAALEESEGVARPPTLPEAAGDSCKSTGGGKEVTFWYSTGDTRSTNTKDDIDVELISLSRFFGQLLRAEIVGVETLHSMLVENIAIVSDPEIVPLIVRERRWLVSKQLSSWVGFVLGHLKKYRKVTHRSNVAQRKVLRRKRELHAALLLENRLAAAAAASESVLGAAAAAAAAAAARPASTLPSSPSSPSSSSTTSVPAAPTAVPASGEGGSGGKASAGPLPAAAAAAASENRAGKKAGRTALGVAPGSGGGGVAGAEEGTAARGARQLDLLSRSDGGESPAFSPATGARRLGVISRGHGGDAVSSKREGRRLGVIARRGTEEVAAGGGDNKVPLPSGPPRRLGVLSRGGVEVGRRRANGDDGSGEGDESEDEEEEEGDPEAKELARRVRRGKLLLHARRGVMEAQELLATGRLVFPLRPSYVKELLRLKELDCSRNKVGAIQAQARKLDDLAARSALPAEIRPEKVAAVQAEAMEVHGRRRRHRRRLTDLAGAGEH